MKIGITYTGTEPKHHDYANWVKGKDAIEIIKLSEELNNISEVSSCDGVVLSGGVDIAPEFYGASGNYPHAPEKYNKERDAFEAAVFQETQQQGIPVLGICRGMQLINCIYGGTLQQDIAEKNAVHKITGVADKVHGISIAAGTTIHEITGSEYAAVNSAHHQAIGKLGTGLTITAVSEDGIAEVLERVDTGKSSFLLCVQWHPERMYKFGLQDTAASGGLRQLFLNAIKTK